MRNAVGKIVAACCVVVAGFACSPLRGQTVTPTCAPSGKKPPGQTATADPCPPAEVPSPGAGKRFPYPGESTPEQAPRPASASPAAEPAPAGGSAPAEAPASKRFPYPGESGTGSAENKTRSSASGQGSSGAGQGGLQDAGSSGESSSSPGASDSSSQQVPTPAQSSSSSSSSANQGSPYTDPDPGSAPAPKRGRRKLPPVARQTPSEREEEDVRVAGFYQNDGNFAAAYSRAHDAVSLVNDDAEAHLALAEAARRLGKLDEAQQHYKRCLELDPVPKVRKVAERALKEMSGGGA